MATITTAKAGLVTFGATVAKIGGGFCASYDIKTLYDAIAAAAPATITPPFCVAVLDLEAEMQWEAMAMLGNAPQQHFTMQQFLCVAKVEDGQDFTALEPDIVTYTDNWFAALKAQPYLTPATAPAIHWSPKGRTVIRRSKWGETEWHSIIFSLDTGINT